MYLELLYDKKKYRERNISISNSYKPSKCKMEMRLDDLKNVFDIDSYDYINRKSISIYNNTNQITKNRLLSNEKDYIVLFSFDYSNKYYSSDKYYKNILDIVRSNNINKYVVNIYHKKDFFHFKNMIDIIHKNFNIYCICILDLPENIDKNKSKNIDFIKWFYELFGIFKIKDKINNDFINNLINTIKFQIYKHNNLKLLIVDENNYINNLKNDDILKFLL